MTDRSETIHIGHYVLGRTIGTGGFAKVKCTYCDQCSEAWHDETNVKVAIKIINKRKMRNKNMISKVCCRLCKVKREIKILKFINHPNIIKLYEVLDTTNEIFVIMEMAERGDLYDFIQNNNIDEELARFFFKQIVSGVEYVHQNLIAHRDLKPENILMDSSNLIKIVDFGLSNLMKDGRLLKTACGSPNYAAPEIVGERKYEGTSVDIWSCGVILYTLLMGSFPFEEETLSLLYKKIQKGEYTISNSISPAARDLVHRMLQVDPTRRIKIFEIKNHPWIRSKIPIYSKISGSYSLEKQSEFELDQQIFKRVKALTASSDDTSEQKIIKAIKKRDDESFVITYELMKDEKYRKQNALMSLKKFNADDLSADTIFKQVENTVVLGMPVAAKVYDYGKSFFKPSKQLAEILIQSMKTIGIDFTIKNIDYCFKCVYVPYNYKKISVRSNNNNAAVASSNDKMTAEAEQEPKFSKKEIKFTLQMYMVNAKTNEHLIDLQLTQGHPIIFFSLSNKIYDLLDKIAT